MLIMVYEVNDVQQRCGGTKRILLSRCGEMDFAVSICVVRHSTF